MRLFILLPKLSSHLGRFFCTEASSVPLRTTRHKSQTTQTAKVFIDSKRVRAVGGKGGDGCISFLQLWANDSAGPDGGDGGNGGHVIIQATSSVRDLNYLPTVIKGDNGNDGHKKDCHGKNASHSIFKVPLGTVVKSPYGDVLGDLDVEGSLYVLARGGVGGRGNHFFTSDTEQSPNVAEYGAKGEDIAYIIDVKCIAQFGLVGFPNAGKSSLLQAISRARPKVAPYPFTTLNPHVGMVQYSDFEQIAVADLPGLIEGSSLNRGLGISFLKHLERCTCLLMVLDLSNNPLEHLAILRNEIASFNSTLPSRPYIIVANKLDIPGAEEALISLVESEGDSNVIAVSAKHGTNLTQLLLRMRKIFDNRTRYEAKTNDIS